MTEIRMRIRVFERIMKTPARLLTVHGKGSNRRQMFAAIFKKKYVVRKKHLMTLILPFNFKTRLLQENLILLQANNKGADQTANHRSQNRAVVC